MSSIELLKQFMASKLLSPSEIAGNRFAALATYRSLVRAIYLSFRGMYMYIEIYIHSPIQDVSFDTDQHLDDTRVKSAARTLARDGFIKNQKLESGSPEATQAIEHAQGVAQILRENVVQGVNKGGEHYGLRFTKHTQRLDNNTAGELKGTTKSFKEIKQAQF